MIGLSLNTKACMSKLLLKDTFDEFLLVEGEITTFNRFSFDGFVKKEFFKDVDDLECPEALPEYSKWTMLKGFCLSLIKGNRTPLSFKFVFKLPEERVQQFIEREHLSLKTADVQGLYLNFNYDGSHLTCITGTSLNIFTLDKTLEQAFDLWVKAFFSANEIAWEEE